MSLFYHGSPSHFSTRDYASILSVTIETMSLFYQGLCLIFQTFWLKFYCIFSLSSLISGFSVLGYARIHCIVLCVCDMFVPGSLFSSTSTTPFPSHLISSFSSFLSFNISRML